VRTFWHAFYYPEDRKVRLSFYLRDEPIPGETTLIHPVMTDYLEFRLEPTGKDPDKAQAAATAPSEMETPLAAAGGKVKREGKRIVGVGFGDTANFAAALPLLRKLPDLEELNAGAKMTSAELAKLADLPKLQGLGLQGAPVGDDALTVLKTLPALRQLNLGGTKVTDAGLEQLAGLELEWLGLKGTAVTDAGLPHLRKLKRIEGLNLADTAITDAGLEQIGSLTGITGLNVSGTKITDAGLVHLKTIPRLTKLNVTGTAVTEQGAKDAKKFLPFWATITR
jgi:Leucine-rich repeat (LRR) protein